MNLDRYFQALYERTNSKQDLVTAGWIENKPLRINPHVRFYTTPLQAIRDAGKKDVSVLFYPGCFAPVHEGHLGAMRLAKEAIETQTGETVAAGYFTPDHDNYIMRKTHDERFIAPNRIALLHEAVENEPWMQVDDWASLYAPTDLNFTTLYDRFNLYLKRWLPDLNIKLYMVFGGDNYMFANSFTEYGHGVCVPREGAQMDLSLVHPDAKKRVIFSEKVCTDHSSTAARAANPGAIDIHGRSALGSTYVLREDLDLAFRENPTTYSNKIIADSVAILLQAHVPYEKVKVKRVPIIRQMANHTETENVISLDCFWKAEQNLEISRLFSTGGSQHHAIKYVNRPGSPALQEQVEAIPAGVYTLVDDDIATGETMSFVSNMLETHDVIVDKQDSLISELGSDLYDVVDLRDFVLGTEHGGLTVATPTGETTRMPYIAPYVNLVSRARINPDRVFSFSTELWKLNYALYRNTKITVGDIKEHQDFTMFGFAEDMTVADLCQKHLQLMTELQ